MGHHWNVCPGAVHQLAGGCPARVAPHITGLEKAEMLRTGYAIEYDCHRPHAALALAGDETGRRTCLLAGQINGTSGYEEAAGQGIMAGINAARKVQGKEPVILDRSQAYIGVMIDDLVTKGTYEPYRLLTSRAEYRLSFAMTTRTCA